MYPLVPCNYCGGGIQFILELVGHPVICRHCGATIMMPGGMAPQAPTMPNYMTASPEVARDIPTQHRSYVRRRRKEAPIWPGLMFGSGLAMVLYFAVLKDSSWLVITLENENDTVSAAMLRKFMGGMDTATISGLAVGGLLCLFGAACFLLGRTTK